MSQKGTTTFVLQRASAVLLLPLAIWFLIAIVAHAGDSFEEMKTWLAKPWTSIPLAAFIVIGVFHGRIGLSEIIVDYIHSWMKDVLIVASWIAALAIMAVTIWSVYQISFAG